MDGTSDSARSRVVASFASSPSFDASISMLSMVAVSESEVLSSASADGLDAASCEGEVNLSTLLGLRLT